MSSPFAAVGRLRHRVTVETPAEERDPFGEAVKTWAVVGTYFADVRPLVGREAEVARQVRADLTHAVTFRARTVVGPGDRLTYLGRIFNVESSLNVDERNRQLNLLCREVVL